jgi:hypothetical protein
MRFTIPLPYSLGLLAALGAQPLAQQNTRNVVHPVEHVSIPATTVEWSYLVELQASFPELSGGGESVPVMAIEPPIVDLPVPDETVVRTRPHAGSQQLSGSCTGFPSEPALGAGFVAQDDVPDSGLFMYIPPNVAGAAGPDHLMTMMNNQVQIRDRLGASLSSVDPAVFWLPVSGSSIAFPRVNYDALHSRWIATARSGATAAVQALLLAVSTTDDPTGSWSFYSIDADAADTQSPDWLTQGYNGNWITMTANMFTGATFNGAKMWVVDQTTVGGTLGVSVFATGFMATVHPGAAGASTMPSRALDGSLADMYLLNDSFTSGGVFLLQLTRISGAPGAPVASGLPGSPFGGTTSFCFTTTNWSATQRTIAQVGDARFISPFSIRMASVAVRNGKIWAVNSGGLPGPSTNTTPTSNGLIWRQIDPSLPFPATPGAPGSMLLQDGAVTDGTDTMAAYPSIAANCADDVLIGFSRGDATKNPECAYVMRLGTDPLSTMGTTKLLKAGDSSYWKNFGVGTTAQWGLYSSTMVDPNDDQTLWTVQEYAALRVGPADNDSRWGTWWGRLGDCDIRPVITDEPDSVVACIGDPVSFSVSATSSLPLMYQWRLDGVDILGATSDTYSIGSAIAADQGTYDVVVSGCGQTISMPATLSLPGATVTTHPVDFTAAVGDPAMFFVAGTGTGTLTYQWLADGAPISGATSDTLIIPSVSLADYFVEFSCIITDDCGPATSDAARLLPPYETGKRQPAELSLHVYKDPESTLGCVGSPVTFEVTAFPEGVTYEWRKDGVPIVPAETNSTLTIPAVSLADAGAYDVVVSLGPQSKTSAAATLTVGDVPVITMHPRPASKRVHLPASITYTVAATGEGPLTYQWQHRSTAAFAPWLNIPAETEPTLVLDPIEPGDAGSYRCIVTNPCGSTISNIAQLIIL